jgi:hypothetical protein
MKKELVRKEKKACAGKEERTPQPIPYRKQHLETYVLNLATASHAFQ